MFIGDCSHSTVYKCRYANYGQKIEPFISFSPYSVCSRCLFLHWSSPLLIFLPPLLNVRPKVEYNGCRIVCPVALFPIVSFCPWFHFSFLSRFFITSLTTYFIVLNNFSRLNFFKASQIAGCVTTMLLGWLSNRTGTSDYDVKARGIMWILLQFDHIWVFLLCAPFWRDVHVLLLKRPISFRSHKSMESTPSARRGRHFNMYLFFFFVHLVST